MRAAIAKAMESQNAGDYGIGAVVVKDGEILVAGTNRAKMEEDSTQHAETAVIREAFKKSGSRFLPSCVLYTTHEPCPMCAAAAVWACMDEIVFDSTLQDMIDHRKKNGNTEWTWRTIDIPATAVLAQGEPKLDQECALRDLCNGPAKSCEAFGIAEKRKTHSPIRSVRHI